MSIFLLRNNLFKINLEFFYNFGLREDRTIFGRYNECMAKKFNLSVNKVNDESERSIERE